MPPAPGWVRSSGRSGRRPERSVAKATEVGADPARFSVSGHSAGAHLASLLSHAPSRPAPPADREAPDGPTPCGMLLVSGHLRPVRHSRQLPEARGRDDTRGKVRVGRRLPLRSLPAGRASSRGAPTRTRPFHDQADRFAALLRGGGHAVTSRTESDLNHLTVVLAMADERHALGRLLGDMVQMLAPLANRDRRRSDLTTPAAPDHLRLVAASRCFDANTHGKKKGAVARLRLRPQSTSKG